MQPSYTNQNENVVKDYWLQKIQGNDPKLCSAGNQLKLVTGEQGFVASIQRTWARFLIFVGYLTPHQLAAVGLPSLDVGKEKIMHATIVEFLESGKQSSQLENDIARVSICLEDGKIFSRTKEDGATKNCEEFVPEIAEKLGLATNHPLAIKVLSLLGQNLSVPVAEALDENGNMPVVAGRLVRILKPTENEFIVEINDLFKLRRVDIEGTPSTVGYARATTTLHCPVGESEYSGSFRINNL